MTENNHAQPLEKKYFDTLRIISISERKTAFVGEIVTYTADYEQIKPSESADIKNIIWEIKVDGILVRTLFGETIEFKVKTEWEGKEITVNARDFFGQFDENIGQKTKIENESNTTGKFLVHFRRPDGYDGSYGFDWLQPEFENCDSSFDLKKEYNPTKIHEQEYLTPWLSIAKGQTIKVNLTIEVLTDSHPLSDNDIIKLPAQKGIRFNPEEIKAKDITGTVKHFPTGEDKGIAIEVTCDDTVSTDTIVNVYNQEDTVIGNLSLFKNDKEYLMPIRVVQLVREGFESEDENSMIMHLINSADFSGCFEISECMERVEEYMNKYAYNQAFVRCQMERGSDNVIKTHTVTINETEWKNKNYINAGGEIFDRDNLNSDLLNIYKNQIEKKTRFFKGIILFITNFKAAGMAGKGNLNIIDDRNCILFKNGGITKKDVYVHEIGHVLSLSHPFQKRDVKKIQQREQEVVAANNYLNNPKVSQENKRIFWQENKEGIKYKNRQSYLYYRNKYTFYESDKNNPEKGATKCMFMDYTVDRKVFTQWQWRTIQESVKRYFSR